MNQEHVSLLLSALLLLGMVLLLDVGFRVGARRLAERPESSHEGIGVIEAAVFALLGLLLAFSLSDGMARLEERRKLIVDEANAISTAYERLNLLPAADQQELRKLFREYLDARIAAYERLPDRRSAQAGMEQAEELENQIWDKAVDAVRRNPDRAAELLLLPALGEMDSVTTQRKVALDEHVPPLVFALMMVVALLSALLAGYAMAKRRLRSWLHLVLYAVVVSVTVFVLLDLEYPRAGHVQLRAVDRAMYELRNSIR